MADNNNVKAKVTALTVGSVLGIIGLGLGAVNLMGDKAGVARFAPSKMDRETAAELSSSLDALRETQAINATVAEVAPLEVRKKTTGGKPPRLAPIFFAPQLWQIRQGDHNTVVDIYDEQSPTIHEGIPNLWFIENGLMADMGKAGAADMDSDGDGFTNREEYTAQTNPSDPDSCPPVVGGNIVKLEATKVETTRAQLLLEAMFADPSYKTDTVGITVTRLTKKGLPTKDSEKKDYKVGDDVKVLKEAKRFRVKEFATKEFPAAYDPSVKETERVLVLEDCYNPKAAPISVRAGRPRANEHAEHRHGMDIADTAVTFRITAGKDRGKEFKVLLGQGFTVPGCQAACTLREVNEVQNSVTISVQGVESPINVPMAAETANNSAE